jgi:DNA-binding MarR family transcriptional regulator
MPDASARTRTTTTRSRVRRAVPRPTRRGDVTGAVDAVRRLVRGLRLAEQRTRAEAGLSAAQLFVLAELADSAATSLGDLAERTMTDRSSVAAVVERLEEAGLVVSQRAENDRRRLLVRLTAAGRRRLASTAPAPTVLLVHALEKLPPAELAGLTRHLGALVSAMGLDEGPATMLFEDGGGRP